VKLAQFKAPTVPSVNNQTIELLSHTVFVKRVFLNINFKQFANNAILNVKNVKIIQQIASLARIIPTDYHLLIVFVPIITLKIRLIPSAILVIM
jgi:hypothetical protein